jgi:DNA invertase Pin-like site-specific DNA recombinase
MIAVYARVSSKRQDQRAQMDELRAWAKGQEEPAEFYSERESGTSMERPEWRRLWRDLLADRQAGPNRAGPAGAAGRVG